MARAAQDQAKQTFQAGQGVLKTAQGVESLAQGNATALFNQLSPEYTAEVNNPQGYGPAGLNAINTSTQQSLGGSTSGAVGQGMLTAARTRNAGGYQAAINESAREGMRRNAQLATETAAQNEQLKQQQKQAGLSGLSGLYGTNMNEVLGALGAENNSLGEMNNSTNALTNAGNSGWLQNTLGVLNTLGNLGADATGAKKAFG